MYSFDDTIDKVFKEQFDALNKRGFSKIMKTNVTFPIIIILPKRK